VAVLRVLGSGVLWARAGVDGDHAAGIGKVALQDSAAWKGLEYWNLSVGDGPDVVCVPGFSDAVASWDPLAARTGSGEGTGDGGAPGRYHGTLRCQLRDARATRTTSRSSRSCPR
jgi:hypothetical protein